MLVTMYEVSDNERLIEVPSCYDDRVPASTLKQFTLAVQFASEHHYHSLITLGDNTFLVTPVSWKDPNSNKFIDCAGREL